MASCLDSSKAQSIGCDTEPICAVEAKKSRVEIIKVDTVKALKHQDIFQQYYNSEIQEEEEEDEDEEEASEEDGDLWKRRSS
ncbi:uncharacterized protein N7483_009237 [Penicillium malachiteum]|uniref:uncharacterized protein n=1 Tax=Penicillium malachiteum TaxID=1324776 RepID=UPI0025487A05|nr:uncharacterized protein N7483_009237 [Penicillium malachiteum]KAJ5721303.1 hypothetical protein N7483_009237 [Penicillium malachiteum]